MTRTKSEKIYAYIAATCFGVCAIRVLMNIFKYSFEATIVFKWILLVAMSISLFVRKRKAAIVASIAYAVYEIYNNISTIRVFYNLHSSYSLLGPFAIKNYFNYIAYCVAYGALIILALFAIKYNKILPKVWFLPGAVMLLVFVFVWLMHAKYGYFSISTEWPYVIISIVEVIAILFMGLWLKEDMILARDGAVP